MELAIPVIYWNSLQRGMTLTLEGRTIKPDLVLGKNRKGLKVCYCTDSRPTNDLAEFIKGSDLFICEGMYGDENDRPKAELKKHMTFSEAGILAKQGQVKELWLSHYSPSLTKPEIYLEAVRGIFRNTLVGKDLRFMTLKFTD